MIDKLPFVDIHTHVQHTYENIVEVVNVRADQGELPLAEVNSIGWHPWGIEGEGDVCLLQSRMEMAKQNNIVAIGECGLDRTIKIPIETQKQIFKVQVEMAIALQKPLIVHCVRAYSDLLEVLKNIKFSGTAILHAFNGNEVQVAQLLKFGCYFSFGEVLLHENEKLHTIFRQIDIGRVFLETDVSEVHIEKIYLRAAELRAMGLGELKTQVGKNYKRIFQHGMD